LTNAIEAIALVLVSIGAVWLSLFSRSHGVKNWWAYMVSVPFLLYLAVAAATGHHIGGRTG
jgi:hypothetical protein